MTCGRIGPMKWRILRVTFDITFVAGEMANAIEMVHQTYEEIWIIVTQHLDLSDQLACVSRNKILFSNHLSKISSPTETNLYFLLLTKLMSGYCKFLLKTYPNRIRYFRVKKYMTTFCWDQIKFYWYLLLVQKCWTLHTDMMWNCKKTIMWPYAIRQLNH